jgi:hypothetical protein
MGAMSSPESVIDIDITQKGKLLCETGIIFLLFGVKTQILQK